MTLIELMVALALLALLATAMATAFRAAHYGYRAVLALNGSLEIVAAQRFLRSVLQTAYPYPSERTSPQAALGVEGDAHTVSFSAPAPMGIGGNGYRNFRIYAATRRDGLADLVVASTLDHPGDSQTQPGRVRETLIARIASLEWSYWDPAAGWIDRWSSRSAPALIRLRIAFPPRDRRSWPELLVAPVVTDAASCQFDTIAQSCRSRL